jgi:hypothetical protein
MCKKWCSLKDVSRRGEVLKGLGEKPGGNKQLGIPRHVWGENNKLGL